LYTNTQIIHTHKMNTPQYKKEYMANLKLQAQINNKNLIANQNQPARQQYEQNTGHYILGNTAQSQYTNIQPKGTKVIKRK